MGFVLAREDDTATSNPKPYDLYIAFRGSRSGSVRAGKYLRLAGNPDWVTDTRAKPIQSLEVNPRGKCSLGFSKSIHYTLPTIMNCLKEIDRKKNNQSPRGIYVTGHSLGGALACYFTSAVRLGGYGLTQGSPMPISIRSWPWSEMKLVTFSAPKVGDKAFTDSFQLKIASKRVFVANDVITRLPPGFEPVGSDIRLSGEIDPLKAHDPAVVRVTLSKNVQNTLGTTGNAPDSPSPWGTFTSLDNVITALQFSKSDLPNIFAGYQEGLADYLDIFSQIINSQNLSQNLSPPVRQLRGVGQPAPTGMPLLKAVADALKQSTATKDNGAFRNFITSWLKLVAVSWQISWQIIEQQQW